MPQGEPEQDLQCQHRLNGGVGVDRGTPVDPGTSAQPRGVRRQPHSQIAPVLQAAVVLGPVGGAVTGLVRVHAASLLRSHLDSPDWSYATTPKTAKSIFINSESNILIETFINVLCRMAYNNVTYCFF